MKKLFRGARWLGVRLAVLIAFLLIVHLVLLVVWKSSVNRQLADLRAKGEPVLPADLAPKPIPDNGNAAIIYQKAFKIVSIPAWSPGKPGSWSEILWKFLDDKTPLREREKLLPEVRRILAKNEAVFPLLGEAAARPKCQFPVHWEQGTSVIFPHLRQLRSCAQLLASRAVIRGRDGDIDGALGDVLLGLRVSDALANEPDMTSQMSRCANVRLVIGALRQVVATQPIPAKQARAIYDGLSRISLADGYALALKAERAIMNSQYELIRNDTWLALGGG